jgi:predicted transposase YdaD
MEQNDGMIQKEFEEFNDMLVKFYWRDRMKKLIRMTYERVEQRYREEARREGRKEAIEEGIKQGMIKTIKIFLANCPDELKKSVKDVAAMFQMEEQDIRPLMV